MLSYLKLIDIAHQIKPQNNTFACDWCGMYQLSLVRDIPYTIFNDGSKSMF